MKTSHARSRGSARCPTYLRVTGWLLLALLCSCGSGSKHERGQEVIAKVNGDEITVREFGDHVARVQSRLGADTRIGNQQVLDSLVDQKLLVQRAVSLGLDRKPQTIAALDRARRQILALATIEHAMESGHSVLDETKAFYDAHPEMFVRRKIFIFRRFDLIAADLQPSLKAQLNKAGSPAEVGFILNRANVEFSARTEFVPAEMLPSGSLKQAAQMQQGDILIFREVGRIVFMQLVRSVAEPIDIAGATPPIREYLEEARRRDAAALVLKNLRSGARIEYAGAQVDGIKVHAIARPPDPNRSAPMRTEVTRVGAISTPK